MSLKSMLQELDREPERVPLAKLTRMLQEVEISPEDVAPFRQFNDEHYRRNLMHEGPGYQALILCWKNGQRSPIHDHRDSSCGVLVLEGAATETTFTRGPNGLLMATRTRKMTEGQVCGSYDADIHQVSNLQDGDTPLVTLHIYSPPLLRMGTYSLTDNTVRMVEDPVHRACHGAGI